MIKDTSGQDRALQPAHTGLLTRPQWIGIGSGIAVVGLLFGAVYAWGLAERSVDIERLRIAKVQRGTLISDVAVDGRIVAAMSRTLYAPAAGTVSLLTEPGKAVKGGDLLATLDSPELRSELDRELAMLEQQEALVAKGRIQAEKQRLLAAKNADEADLTLSAAKREHERTIRACEVGALTRVECMKIVDDLRAAEIRGTHARADAELEGKNVDFDLASSIKNLDRQKVVVAELRRRVESLNLRAPIDGLVGTLSIVDRAQASLNAPLITIVDLSRLEVELSVAEIYAEDIGLGMAASIDLGNNDAEGTVVAIAPEVVANQVLVRVRFAGGQPDGLRQNQRVRGRILLSQKDDVLTLARGPFLEAHGARYVYRVVDGIATRNPVAIGTTSVTAVEITEGLKAGDEVVIAGSENFENAERVRIND
ncbi:MAG: efflux RND transporter periplasmic adaptor subunit [Ahniella sp.]|nr:efflux RND transporter periplasmic adaptor subunit [Ahniella sp.]